VYTWLGPLPHSSPPPATSGRTCSVFLFYDFVEDKI
jgi:hypothetical protein